MNLDKAWQVVDYYIDQYRTREEALEELGNLDELALKIAELIEERGWENEGDVSYLASLVDLVLF